MNIQSIEKNLQSLKRDLEFLDQLVESYYLDHDKFQTLLKRFVGIKISPTYKKYLGKTEQIVVKLCCYYRVPYTTIEKTLYDARFKIKKKLNGAEKAIDSPKPKKVKLNQVIFRNVRLLKGVFVCEDHRVGRNGPSNYTTFQHSLRWKDPVYYHALVHGGGLAVGKRFDRLGVFLALLFSKNVKVNGISGSVHVSSSVQPVNHQGTFTFQYPKTVDGNLLEYSWKYEILSSKTYLSLVPTSSLKKGLRYGLRQGSKRFSTLQNLLNQKVFSKNLLERLTPPNLDLIAF